ncbi:MAG: hypothetical protein KF900_07925 [Bacteroidetes bacterium]|nr:hypothetical protein [Bacteroidota bacterium]
MKIACLGWGSLIWRPESLLIRREWFMDGPFLPIEFVRQSKDGRLTLVIYENAKPIRTLWALMATDDLEKAKQSLKVRESISDENFKSHIAAVTKDEKISDNDTIKTIIQEWAKKMDLDAVIWTNLPPKFNGNRNVAPSIDVAIKYLNGLDIDINTRKTAEEYIRKAPKQIDTEYRRKFESEFGWSFIDNV